MPVCKAIAQTEGVYFITFTCTDWLPLFKICNAYEAVYKWFDNLKAQGHYIVGYVIMPSHVHTIIAFSNTGKNLNTTVSNGKRFIAYELVKRLKEKNRTLILNELNSDLNNTEKKESKIHGVFETSFDWKECRTEKFYSTKVELHSLESCKANKFAELPEQYIDSSAKFYITDKQGVYPVTSFMELSDIDLIKDRETNVLGTHKARSKRHCGERKL